MIYSEYSHFFASQMSLKFLFISFILFFAQWTWADDLQNLQRSWSDTMITTKITAEFARDPSLSPLNISVKTRNGVVKLQGHAKNRTAFVTALRIVANTKNVRSINTTNFDIKTVNSSLEDAYITTKIETEILKAKVFEDESIPLVGINVSTSNGIVTLSGAVKNEHSITVILKRVNHIQGVGKIKSQLRIEESIKNMKQTILVISCEHGSNQVPAKYAHLFDKNKLILQTKRAYDIGALHIAKYMQTILHCELIYTKISRLLIDCEYTSKSRSCFSKFSKNLTAEEKKHIINKYYAPFHTNLQNTIEHHIKQGQQVLHLSLFTFAPFLKGIFVNAGIEILYDAHRHAEKEVARIIHGLLNYETPSYKIRHNIPFSGTHDHILTKFRKNFAEKDYLGIKLGVNQALVSTPETHDNVCKILTHSFRELLELL